VSIEVNDEAESQVDTQALSQLARYVLDAMKINPLAELSIVLLDVAAMSALHEQWMDLPGPTDVMAFPMDAEDTANAESGTDRSGRSGRSGRSTGSAGEDGPGEALLGDVVICPQVAAEQAGQAGHSAESELHLLCTHGILHLLGYDHSTPEEEREMFELQAEILQGWVQATGRPAIKAPLPGTLGESRDDAGAVARGGRRG
jgi:probable rRNA maturation factor